MNTETVQVTQADHDAVVAYLNAVESESGVTVRKVSGNHPLLQAFARHRITSQSLSTDEEVRRLVDGALHDADCVSSRIHAGGYRANLSDVETLRNHVRKLAAALESKDAPSHGRGYLAALKTSTPETQTVEGGEQIPAGMKPWLGGDSAPEDWDGKNVRVRNGMTCPGASVFRWDHQGFGDDIIAYTPKPTTPERSMVLEEAARVAEKHAAPDGVPRIDYDDACRDIAAAIRALSASPIEVAGQ